MTRGEEGRIPEKYEALLTAGIILTGLGVYFLTIPEGVVFGGVLLVAGIVTFAIDLRRAIPAWRTARRDRAARGERLSLARDWAPEGFWNLEGFLSSSVGVGGGWLIVGLLQWLWTREPAWFPIVFGASWMLVAAASLAALRWRRRRTP